MKVDEKISKKQQISEDLADYIQSISQITQKFSIFNNVLKKQVMRNFQSYLNEFRRINSPVTQAQQELLNDLENSFQLFNKYYINHYSFKMASNSQVNSQEYLSGKTYYQVKVILNFLRCLANRGGSG